MTDYDFEFVDGQFAPVGFWVDDKGRVAKKCPQCGLDVYAPGPSAWASMYWKHSATDLYSCD